MSELKSSMPRLDEIKMLRGERHTDIQDQEEGHEDKVITRLRDALNNDEMTTPDEVIHVLTTDVFEKEKVKLQLNYLHGGAEDEAVDDEKFFLLRN